MALNNLPILIEEVMADDLRYERRRLEREVGAAIAERTGFINVSLEQMRGKWAGDERLSAVLTSLREAMCKRTTEIQHELDERLAQMDAEVRRLDMAAEDRWRQKAQAEHEAERMM